MSKLRRRDFIAASGAAAASLASVQTVGAASSGGHAPAVSGVRELRMVTPWPDGVAGLGDSAWRLARRIETMTGGRLRVVTDGVTADGADLLHGFEHGQVERHPAFGYFAGLPGSSAMTLRDFEAWLKVGGGQELWDGLAAGFGVKPLLAGHAGTLPGVWSTKPIGSLADIAGEPILALGLTREVAKGLGAKPVARPMQEWADAFADGSATMAELGGVQTNMAMGLLPRVKSVVTPGLAPCGSAVSLNVKRSVWESLDRADREILAACASEEFRLTVAEIKAHKALLKRTLTEAHGVRVIHAKGDISAKRIGDAVVADVATRDEPARRISASYSAFRQAVSRPHGRGQRLTS